jgi:hypothetical protein
VLADPRPGRCRREPLQIRPLGGTAGCLTMILVSVIASVLLTVLLNVLFR